MSFVFGAIKPLLPSCMASYLSAIHNHHLEQQRNIQISRKNSLKISELLGGAAPIRLELGAGQNRGIAGWTYADMNEECELTLDLSQPLPFPDNCVDMIYSCHLLEHFRYPDLMKLLHECLRILKPGGVFSAAVPNARIYLDAYQNPVNFDSALFCRHEPAYNYNSKIDYVNYMAYMDGHHHYMFDEENLDVILRKTGFKNVRPREFDPTLDMEVRHFQTIYVLCEK